MTLLELINLLKKHLKLVVLLPLACALAMGMFSMLFMSNTLRSAGSWTSAARPDEARDGTM